MVNSTSTSVCLRGNNAPARRSGRTCPAHTGVRTEWLRDAAAIVALLCASPVAAQTSPSTPPGAVSFLVGRVSLIPDFALQDVGFDSNVFTGNDDQKEDFTLTAQPRLRVALPVGGALLTGTATMGLVYYATNKDQQSVNRRVDARLESAISRLRPFVSAAFNHSRERSGAEIDARVLHREASF